MMQRREMQRSIMRQMTGHLLRNSLIYLVGLLVVLLGGYALGHSVVWYGTEPAFLALHWASENARMLGVILFLAGEIVILLVYLWKICGYFQSMIYGMRDVYREEPEESGRAGEQMTKGAAVTQAGVAGQAAAGRGQNWIVLPEELKEAEVQMNLLRQQVQQSRKQAREAEQRKNDLVVYLAHDLKTPLTSVLGYLQLLEEAEIPPALQGKYVAIAHRKAERLEELINEFFEITRFNLTSMELERRSINFTRLLEQTIFEFGPLFKQKRLTCRLVAEPDLSFSCDLDKMQRVVDNLLRNAILYGYEDTELTVSLTVEEAAQRPKELVLTVANHGPTIPPGKLERIFEQFYRLDHARTSSTGGAGLGLAIAKEIVRHHGGRIMAESQAEVTTFVVRLPDRDAQPSVQ